MRRMKAMSRLGILGRPGLAFHRHSALKPRRCQPITVAGLTTSIVPAQSGQRRRRMTQKIRSPGRSLGRDLERRATVSCCRSAAFSRIRFALGFTMARPRARHAERRVRIGAGVPCLNRLGGGGVLGFRGLRYWAARDRQSAEKTMKRCESVGTDEVIDRCRQRMPKETESGAKSGGSGFALPEWATKNPF